MEQAFSRSSNAQKRNPDPIGMCHPNDLYRFEASITRLLVLRFVAATMPLTSSLHQVTKPLA